MSQNIMHTKLVNKIYTTSIWSMQEATKSAKNRVMTCQMMANNLLKWSQYMLEKHATLMSHKWEYTTHTKNKHKVAKPAIDRAKPGPKSHEKVPEPNLKGMKLHAPLIGQKCKQINQEERGSPPSDWRPQNDMPTTENPKYYRG